MHVWANEEEIRELFRSSSSSIENPDVASPAVRIAVDVTKIRNGNKYGLLEEGVRMECVMHVFYFTLSSAEMNVGCCVFWGVADQTIKTNGKSAPNLRTIAATGVIY